MSFHPDFDREYDTPGSPLLPPPDSEVSLPQGQFEEDLDLNPGLDGSTAGYINQFPLGEPVIESLDADGEDLINSNVDEETLARHRLSSTQQSKFINYVDTNILSIHRKFIKAVSIGEYPFETILSDTSNLVEFIWLSMDGALFGQTEYLLTIAGDVLDFIDGMSVKGVERDVLALLDSLDTKFSKILNQMRQTEVVRLVSIAERSRPLVVAAFERSAVHGFHKELGSVYERVLDLV